MPERKRLIPHEPIATYCREIPRNPDKFVWVASTVIVAPHTDQVLCSKRVKTGEWEFPGGKLDPGEDYRDCAIREAKEELGLDVKIQQYICSTILGRLESLFAVQFYLATVRDVEQEIEIEHRTIEEVRWVKASFARELGEWLPATMMAWSPILEAVQEFTTNRALRLQEYMDGDT